MASGSILQKNSDALRPGVNLSQISFTVSDQSNPGLDSPRAWVVVFAGFVGAFVTFGISYCFGVFLKPIALEFHVSHAAVSALFSTITAISFFAAPFTGKLADRYGPRPVVASSLTVSTSMHPTLFQINARVWLNELAGAPGPGGRAPPA